VVLPPFVVGREDQLSKLTWSPIRERHLSYRRARHPFGLGSKEVGRMGRLDMTKAKRQERGPFTPGSDTCHFSTRSDAWDARRHHTPPPPQLPPHNDGPHIAAHGCSFGDPLLKEPSRI